MSLSLTGGRFNGSILKTPTGMTLTRPTSGKVRQALFNVLRGGFEDRDFLDLYAGSGSVGLEAASRGARRAVLVESHPAVFRVLEANARLLAARGADAESLACIRRDARLYCAEAAQKETRFAVVFADPPFGQDFTGLHDAVLPLLETGGTGIIQFPARNPPDFAARADRILEYGESSLAIFHAP